MSPEVDAAAGGVTAGSGTVVGAAGTGALVVGAPGAAVGVVALGMLTNVMGRFDLREVNSTPSAPKPSTRIQ